MTVYVDDMEAKFGRMIMCHMIATDTGELVGMAQAIGVNPKWIQYPGTANEHFDIAIAKRKIAVAYGAVEITMKEYAGLVWQRRYGVPWTEPWVGQRFMETLIAAAVEGDRRQKGY